jgi:alkanesulfonate monooxygenase SsuD/methylene tetrahydromethanopterin reductase-like flavin-dependent oxidoreductase (luciferase family)
MDLGKFDPETPLTELVDEMPGVRGFVASLITEDPKATIRDYLYDSYRKNKIVGTPEKIAHILAEYQQAGVDGIQIMNSLMPGTYEHFFEHAVPVLQKRGLMRTEYSRGTLREKMFPDMGAQVADPHPAAKLAWRE